MKLFTPDQKNHRDLPRGFIAPILSEDNSNHLDSPNLSDDLIIILLVALLLFNESGDDIFNLFVK